MAADLAEYTEHLLAIHGADADDQLLGDELTELAHHALRLGIPNHALDLFLWTQNLHWSAGCGNAGEICGCFRAATAS